MKRLHKYFNKRKWSQFLVRFLLVLTCLGDQAEADEFECTYIEYSDESYGYTCVILAVYHKIDVTISGTHLNGKSDSDVRSVSFSGGVSNEFPNLFIQKFSNLKIIQVQGRQLERIDQEFFQGSKLEKFDARGNSVRRLEADSFVEAVDLKLILLEGNAIHFVHENAFKKLSKLELLELSKNYIATLHKDTFKDLTSLKSIDLYANKIEELPAGLFKNNLNLKEIELSSNKIKIIPADLFKSLNNFNHVNLSYNLCISGYFNTSTLHEEIKKCTEANTLEAKIQQTSNELFSTKKEVASLTNENNQLKENIVVLNDTCNLKSQELLNYKVENQQKLKNLEENLGTQISTITEVCNINLANMTQQITNLEANTVELSKTILTTSKYTCNICVELCGNQKEADEAKKIIANQFSKSSERCKKI